MEYTSEKFIRSGIRLPAEWEPHAATWLSWPNRSGVSFYGDLEPIFPALHAFIERVSRGEEIYINAPDQASRNEVLVGISTEAAARVRFFDIPTNELWCRDHSPTFVLDRGRVQAVGWTFNGWGEQWEYSLDAEAGKMMSGAAGIPYDKSSLVCEGGAIDSNGAGKIMVTESSLMDPNRNPDLAKEEIGSELKRRLGSEEVIWLTGGALEGDDTVGHIDTLARYVAADRVVAGYERGNPVTEKLVEELESYRGGDGEALEIIRLPVPPPPLVKGTLVPANYCNFYIANSVVVVPAFGIEEDAEAETIIRSQFPDREVVMIDSSHLIYGRGSFHCMSHQLPAAEPVIE